MAKRLIVALFIVSVISGAFIANGAERHKYNFNSDWLLNVGDTPEALKADYNDTEWSKVTLPHAFNQHEAFCTDIKDLTDTVMWYRKHFVLDNLDDKKVFVEFEGIRQAGDFYINGEYLGKHENGVMALGYDLTPYVNDGENVISVRIDNDWNYRESATDTPYQWNNRNFNANYGGIPKNVWLHVTDDVYQTLPLYSNLATTGVYIYGTDYDIPNRKATIHAESEVKNDSDRPRTVGYKVTMKDAYGNVVKTFNGENKTIAPGQKATLMAEAEVQDLNFWSWGYGYLYTFDTELIDTDNVPFDKVVTRTGFRKTKFGEGKFWLNDRVMMVHGYAQRTSNEWPGLGIDIPAWVSDYSNACMVEGNGNLVRWMHVTPSKQDVESCDRVGLMQAMPAGDAEKDCEGRQWQQRTELMRDAIIYNRNNPSIIFYESGNESISRDHMIEMIAIRDQYDPKGGRAIGSREMLDIDEAEYGGEMLYINKSHKHPMWATEYCRDEGMRKNWDEYSYPYHKEGDGPLYRGKPADEYNHNSDQLAVEWVRRWYDYWRERPGTGTRVSSGGVKIIFSDTNTHYRCGENYRTSGATDAMRIPKDGYFVHQALWDNWVDIQNPHTYIIGHWNYEPGTVKPVYVVSTSDNVRLLLNGEVLPEPTRMYEFLYVFDNVSYKPGQLEAISYDNEGNEESRYTVKTVGEPARLVLSSINNPQGLHADGADLALLQFEVVDADGNRCPLDNREVTFTLEGEAEWIGGLAQRHYDNYVRSTVLPVECGINRAFIRSTTNAGDIAVTAKAEGLPEAKIYLKSTVVDTSNGVSEYAPSLTLPCRLDRGPTPNTPSYTDRRRGVGVAAVKAGSNQEKACATYDDNELSEWTNDGKLENAWITYTLERPAAIEDVCIKLTGWRSKSYPIEILAGDKVVWAGDTPTSLGYVHLTPETPVESDTYTIRLKGATSDGKGSFGNITELAGGNASELDNAQGGKNSLRIVEVELIEPIK